MRTMKVFFQQCRNYGEIWEYVLCRFTVDLTGIIGIENSNREQGQKYPQNSSSMRERALIASNANAVVP